MNNGALQRLLHRDAIVVLAALAGITALAWVYVLRLAADMDMGGMDMNGLRMVSTGFRMVMTSAYRPWTGSDLLLMFAMWAVMMIGMMTPSVAPVVLLYARVRRHASSQGEPFAATGWFAGGYLLA
jgi:predicted metal-binding membrane protein